MERRVQIFPFRAVFDERKYPGCVREAMEKKDLPPLYCADNPNGLRP